MLLRQNRSWIEEANEKIKITDVLTNIGIFVPSTILNGGNKKIFCPFGFYHSDGGTTKAMRVYLESNTVYCFSCSKRYDPVSLAAAKWDLSRQNAAWKLLEDSGFKPKSLEERWLEATKQEINSPDLIALADALKVYCSTICSSWQNAQFDDEVGAKLNGCLDFLANVRTDEQAHTWLELSKKIMKQILRKKYDDKSNVAG